MFSFRWRALFCRRRSCVRPHWTLGCESAESSGQARQASAVASPAPSDARMSRPRIFADWLCLISGGARCFGDADWGRDIVRHLTAPGCGAAGVHTMRRNRPAHRFRHRYASAMSVSRVPMCVVSCRTVERASEWGQHRVQNACTFDCPIPISCSKNVIYTRSQTRFGRCIARTPQICDCEQAACTRISRPPRRAARKHV